jgi:hypothetical protein
MYIPHSEVPIVNKKAKRMTAAQAHNKPIHDALERFGLLDQLGPDELKLLDEGFIEGDPPLTREEAQANIEVLTAFAHMAREKRRG